MDYITQLRAEFATLHSEATNVLAVAGAAGRDTTVEEKSANVVRYARLESIKNTITEQSRFAAMALDAGFAILPKEPAGRSEYENNTQFTLANGELDFAAIKKGINHFARTGDTRQLFTMTSTTGSGAYLPKEVLQPISVRRLQNSFRAAIDAMGMKPMNVETTASFSLPIADDTASTGQAQSESASSGTQLDATDSSLLIAPTLWSSKQFWYSNTLANSGAFDLMAFVLPMAQRRIDKSQESAWTTTVKAQANGKTVAVNTGITFAELLDWEHSLLPAYRQDAVFIVSDALYRSIRGLVDANGRPILDTDPTGTFVGKVHGKPVIVNDYLDVFGVAKKLGCFISASAINIVDVMDARVVRYQQVPAQPDQIGFEQFQNSDAAFIGKGFSILGT